MSRFVSKNLPKFLLLGSLYISQYLPTTFFWQTLPTFMRQQGASLETIGALGFLVIPWVLKFLWSPLVDRYSLNRDRHYSTWIIFFQVLLAASVALCGLLNVEQNFPLIMAFTLFACFCSASQDIATDALAVGMLGNKERGWGSTMQSAGNYLGAVIGGGGVLILLDRIGWTRSLVVMALIILVAGVPLLRYRERKIPAPPSATQPDFMALIRFFRRPYMLNWTGLLLLYMAGSSMESAMMRPLLIDLKFTLADVGEIVGIFSYSAGILGALIGGVLITVWGRKRSLIWFGIFQAIALLSCIILTFGNTSRLGVYAVNISVQVVSSMAYTGICTIMLDKSESATAGTDYTIQTSLIYLGGILAMFAGGVLAENLGYAPMFAIASGICLLSTGLVQKWYIEGEVYDRI